MIPHSTIPLNHTGLLCRHTLRPKTPSTQTSSHHRCSILLRQIQQWCRSNRVEYACVATVEQNDVVVERCVGYRGEVHGNNQRTREATLLCSCSVTISGNTLGLNCVQDPARLYIESSPPFVSCISVMQLSTNVHDGQNRGLGNCVSYVLKPVSMLLRIGWCKNGTSHG